MSQFIRLLCDKHAIDITKPFEQYYRKWAHRYGYNKNGYNKMKYTEFWHRTTDELAIHLGHKDKCRCKNHD